MGYGYAENQAEFIHDDEGRIISCKECGADVYWDKDGERFIFTCPCGEVDLDRLPEYYKD